MDNSEFLNPEKIDLELLHITRGTHINKVLLSVAFLSLLRWLDGQKGDGERKELLNVAPEGNTYERDLGSRTDYSWDALRRLTPDDFRALLLHPDAAEQLSLPEVLRGLYDIVSEIVQESSAMADSVIESCTRWVNSQPEPTTAEGRQAFSDAFERLLTLVVLKRKTTAESQTPPAVANLMLDLAAPRAGERIYDPCFGIGGLLARASKRLGVTSAPSGIFQGGQTMICGGEINRTAYGIGAVRIVLAGALPQLRLGDSLERDISHFPIKERFDCVLAVPPFGQRIKWGKYPGYPIASTDATDLFLQHIVRALRPGGRAVVAVPDGFRYRGRATKKVRKWLMQEHRLEAVLPLPERAFTPYTSIRTSLLVVRRLESKNVVWFFAENHVTRAVGGTSQRSKRVKAKRWQQEDAQESRADVAEALHALQQNKDIDRLQTSIGALAAPVKVSKLAEREYELLKKREGAEELQSFLEEAQEQIPGIDIHALHDIAEISSGATYRQSDTTEGTSAKGPFLIRIGDIVDGTLRRPAQRYSTPTTSKQGRSFVQSGDVLLSTSGTIGKVAVVPPEFDGAVASSGVAILRVKEAKESVRPGYLAKLLRSALYQDWLAGHARGSTIGHLRLSSLKKLPIPVLPLEQQERVETAVAKGADASEIMKALAEARTPDPLRSWLLSKSVASGFTPWAAVSVGAAAYKVWNAYKHMREQSRDEKLSAWMGHFTEVGHQLEEAMEIEPGPERYAMLESLGLPARDLLESVPEGEPAVHERAQALSNSLVKQIERERKSLLNDVDVTAYLEPAVIDLGDTGSLTLYLENNGALRLRQLDVKVLELKASKEASQFPAGNTVTIELQAPAGTAGEHALTVQWQATRLDGTKTSGEIEVAYRVRGVQESVTGDFREFGRNPYIAGKRLRPDKEKHRDLFKGRQMTIERLTDALEGQGGAATVIIEGARRIGKSSLAGQVVAASQMREDWLPVYCDLQGEKGYQGGVDEAGQPIEGLEAEGVFYGIARALAFAATDEGIAFEAPGYGQVTDGPMDLLEKNELQECLRASFYESSSPVHLLDLFVSQLLDAVAPRTVLLIIDEFDKIQQGIQNGITNPQVPDNLRSLFQSYDIAVIIIGSPRLRRLREQYFNALYGFAEPVALGPLDEAAARQLVTEPVAGRIVYAPAAADYILELTACHPHIIQSLCREVFSTCKDTETRTVTKAMVEKCANTVAPTLPHFKHVFETDTESDRKRYLIAVTEANGEREKLTFTSFEQYLENDGIGTRGLEDDLDDLVHEEILEREDFRGEAVYRLRIPLLSFWLRNTENYDYAILRSRAAAEHPA